MKDEIINAAYIRMEAKRMENALFDWMDDTELRGILDKQNDLLFKAADRIEELETGMRNLLKKYQGN